jgi:hypothetical protein
MARGEIGVGVALARARYAAAIPIATMIAMAATPPHVTSC